MNQPALSVIRERLLPGMAETRHRHRQARQFFFVLKGDAVLEAGGTEVALGAGEGLEVAPGLLHQIFNRSEAALEFLVVSHPHPHSHDDREPA